MRYVTWASFYEGNADALYFDVLVPRVIRDLVSREGRELVEIPDMPSVKLGKNGRSVNSVVNEICSFKNALDVVFIHADTGGRNVEQGLLGRSDNYCIALNVRCNWRKERCITITPRHETEAWLLGDAEAVTSALGFNGSPAEVGLPTDARAAERLIDPKQVLRAAIEVIAGRRRAQSAENLFPAIAQRQRLESLRGSSSFVSFEGKLRVCLQDLRCIEPRRQ